MKYLLNSQIGHPDEPSQEFDSWLGLHDIASINIEYNPLLAPIDDVIFEKHPGLFEANMLRNIDYLSYFTMLATEVELPPIQQVILRQIWTHAFPMLCFSRGASKSYTLGLYALIRCVLVPGSKIVVAGSVFRQSKGIFTYCEQIWKKSPILRSMVKDSRIKFGLDMWEFHLGDSCILAIPIGNGEKVRGLRATTVIADEFAAHNPRIVEEVLSGFAAVKADPMTSYKEASRIKVLQEKGRDTRLQELELSAQIGNQTIISGTADYHFNHYYTYWQKYCSIIKCKGNVKELAKLGIQMENPDDYKKYMVARIPWWMTMVKNQEGKILGGFMSEEIINRQKTQMSVALFNKEYEAIFISDSDGFFKRSTIEGCTASERNIDLGLIPSYCPVTFEIQSSGIPEATYVMGVDVARMQDNFAIVINQVLETHQRIVYCWTTNENDYGKKLKANLTTESSYNAFCARHVRNLLNSFYCPYIAVDAQGGGRGLTDSLKDSNMLVDGDVPILPIIDPKKPADTDRMSGNHIIKHINYGAYNWIEPANYELLADMESKRLLFPNYDALTSELSIADDKRRLEKFKIQNPNISPNVIKLFDSMENIVDEIEQLKDELTSVIAVKSSDSIGSRLVWKVPDVRVDGKTKTVGKKDRYSALLMANWMGRRLMDAPKQADYNYDGGLITQFSGNTHTSEPMYSSNLFTESVTDGFGTIV